MFKNIFPSIRIKQFISNPVYIFYWCMRFIVYKKKSFDYVDKYNNIHQFDEDYTLKYIIENNKSIIRLGDGEFGILSGAGIYCGIRPGFFKFNWCQKYSGKLKKELIRILSNKNNSILIAFPPIWHIIHDDRKGQVFSHKELIHSNMHIEARMLLWKFINRDSVYGSWSVFMPQHNDKLNWKIIYEYIKNKTVIIVTGNTEKIKNVILGKRTIFLESGVLNAFERRYEIFNLIKNTIDSESLVKDNCIFFVSLGPTASCVVEYISNQGLIGWDTGHLFQFAEKEIQKLM